MADPTNKIPHLLGILLDASGIAKTNVVAINRTTGNKLVRSTDANKRVIFDLSQMTDGYSASDVIEFNNAGASVGQTTITVNSATGGFQEATMVTAASPTASINL